MEASDARAELRREAERALPVVVSGERLRDLLETTGRYDEAYWAHCRTQGWTAIGIPERHGGLGLGLPELCTLAEAAGAHAVGAPWLELQFAAAQALLRQEGEPVGAEWLTRLATGEAIALLSIAEGADPLPDRPTLRWADGRLEGVRAAVPGFAAADLAVVLAAAPDGPALVLADLRAEGVERRVIATFDNSRCTADLAFSGTPARRLRLADAATTARELVEVQAVLAAHQQLGGAAAMLARARDHAVQRRAFGQPIGAFQSVKHRIAEGYILVQLAKAAAEAAVAAHGGEGFSRAAMAARLLGGDAYETVVRDAIQVHGAMGVTWEADFHLHQRRARTLALELGPAFAWEDRLAEALAEGSW